MLVSTTSHFLLPRNAPADKAGEYKDKEKQRMQNLIDFVQKQGKGVAGIHAATDAYGDWPQYGELIGGLFNNHPWNEKVGVKVDDPASPLTAMFDAKAGLMSRTRSISSLPRRTRMVSTSPILAKNNMCSSAWT